MKKSITIGVILLFILSTVASMAVGFDISTPTEKIDTEESNHPISDKYEEIITFIKGNALLNWIEQRGYFRGEVNITLGSMISLIILSGFRRSEGVMEYFNESVDFVHAYRFIGYSPDYSYPEFAPSVIGIALGNIEWS